MIARALNLLDGTIPATTVTDLTNSNATTQEAVAKLVNKGIVSGFLDKTFRPDETVKREQMAKYIANAYDLKLGDGVTDFADVDSKSALAVYVDAIAEAGITIGKTDGTFGFGDKLKRADFSAMVYRAENLEEVVSGVSVVEATYDDDTKDQFVAIKLDGKRVTTQELITEGYDC